MQNQWLNAKTDEIQGHADCHENKDFSAALQDIYFPTHTTTVPGKSVDSLTLTTDKGEILQGWQQHFSDLLNTSSNIIDETLTRVVDQPIS